VGEYSGAVPHFPDPCPGGVAPSLKMSEILCTGPKSSEKPSSIDTAMCRFAVQSAVDGRSEARTVVCHPSCIVWKTEHFSPPYLLSRAFVRVLGRFKLKRN
jgi:hypothetical protein